ncbi:phage tail tip lysozyme [Streptococcus ovis]|uniref:phage tail tip lysozyme n=1 Tax=Streptococcus ovis TaxID=82806 RepID=UPI0003650099|nr:phage tail tip lysozyme [Streptococcus ovis]
MARKARRELRRAKANLVDAKKELSEANSRYRLVKKETPKTYKASTSAEARYLKKRASVKQSIAKEEVRQAKYKKKEAVKSKKKAVNRAGGSLKKRIAKKGYGNIRSTTETAVRDNDILSDIASTRQKIRHTNVSIQQTKHAFRYAGGIASKTGRATYSLSNRTYNLVKGRGFTRTPKMNRWETKAAYRLRQLRMRVASNKVVKRFKTASKWGSYIMRPLKAILANPLSLKAYLISFLLLCTIALFVGNTSTVEQDEFDLNKSWLQLSKRDREETTSEVEYWTNIDDILYFMNYRYGGEWNPESSWKEGRGGELAGNLGFNHYSDALNDIWNHLNKDTSNLKKMSDLYGDSSDLKWAKLSNNQLQEYKELLELSEEVGKYTNYQELENPFYPLTDEKATEPLPISKRFGYETKSKIYNGTTFQVEKGRTVIAPISGTIEVTPEKDVLICTSEAIITFKNLSEVKHETGAQVVVGESIGTVSSDIGQEVYYQKLEEAAASKKDKDKWTYVNPGFYLPKVKYLQETFILTTNVDADQGQRVQFILSYFKKHVPGLKLEGLASILGNWDVESSITARRAEGDYLNPPIGASTNSWDDSAWLSINGPSIYNGRYPNILHRGIGLGQWTDTADGSTRHTLLLNYAKSKNKKWYDLELQLDFMLHGDAPWYQQKAREILTSSASVEESTRNFLIEWEGNSGDKLGARIASAQKWLSYLKNNKNKGRGKHMFNEPYIVVQPWGKTPWSQGAGAWMYPKGRHDGVDLAAVRANYNSSVVYANDIPVFAVLGGTVVRVAGPTPWGNSIVIQTDLGGYTYYGHLKYVPKFNSGDRIEQGQQIAVLGDTGTVGVPHVHFQYYIGDFANDVDPSFLFKDKGTLLQNEVIVP